MANECNCGCDNWCFGSCSIQVRDAYRTTPGSGAGTGLWPQLSGVYDTISMKLCLQLYRCDYFYQQSRDNPFMEVPEVPFPCYVNITGVDVYHDGADEIVCPLVTGIPIRAWEEGTLEDTFCANITYVIPNVNTGVPYFSGDLPIESWNQCYDIYHEVVCDSGIEPFPLGVFPSTNSCIGCQDKVRVCVDNVAPAEYRGPWDDESGRIYPTNANPNWIPVRRKAQEWQNTYPDQSGVYKGGYVTPSGLGGF